MTEDTAVRPEPRAPRFGLSGKLLVLTILFVMIAEVLIYVPSVANFRVVWLKDRLATAYTAALVLDAAPNGVVSYHLAQRILHSIGARAGGPHWGVPQHVCEAPSRLDGRAVGLHEEGIAASDDRGRRYAAGGSRHLRH